MTNNIYLLRDKVSQTLKICFSHVNDASAVRAVVDGYGKDPHYNDYELQRFDYAFDIQTLRPVQSECAVIALPSPQDAPVMPVGQGVASVELKK